MSTPQTNDTDGNARPRKFKRPTWKFTGRRGRPPQDAPEQDAGLPPELQGSLERIAAERALRSGAGTPVTETSGPAVDSAPRADTPTEGGTGQPAETRSQASALAKSLHQQRQTRNEDAPGSAAPSHPATTDEEPEIYLPDIDDDGEAAPAAGSEAETTQPVPEPVEPAVAAEPVMPLAPPSTADLVEPVVVADADATSPNEPRPTPEERPTSVADEPWDLTGDGATRKPDPWNESGEAAELRPLVSEPAPAVASDELVVPAPVSPTSSTATTSSTPGVPSAVASGAAVPVPEIRLPGSRIPVPTPAERTLRSLTSRLLPQEGAAGTGTDEARSARGAGSESRPKSPDVRKPPTAAGRKVLRDTRARASERPLPAAEAEARGRLERKHAELRAQFAEWGERLS